MGGRAPSGDAGVPGKQTRVEQITLQASPTPVQRAGASAASRTVAGQGGYTYEQREDGSITIVAGPSNAGKSYPLGHPVNRAITDEIGGFPAPAASPDAPAAAPPAPPAPTTEPSQAPSMLARAQSGFSGFVGWLGSFMPGSGEQPAGGGSGEAPVFGQEPDSCDAGPSELEELMTQQRLTPEQINRARELIGELPPDQQKPKFLELQSKSAYLNQRDNKSAQEGEDGGTCNFTSVAMVLEYLGVANPDPSRQFEDVLIEKANGAKIKNASTWEAVAKQFGVTMKPVIMGATDAGRTISRAEWESVRDNHLAAGEGVVIGLRGHVIRLQGMNEAGLIVDDPYGASTLAADKRVERDGETERYWWEADGVNDKDAGSHKGEDHGYPWKDVETYRFKYVIAFSR